MDKLYARFVDIRADYMYPGAVDHFAEGDIVAYSHALQRNAVYVVAGHEGRLAKIDCTNRPVFVTETILEKGSLAAKLCSPFDAAGRSVSRLIDPNALVHWIPEVGDEVFIDGKFGVVSARENKNGLAEVDVVKEFKKPIPDEVVKYSVPSWRREFLFSRVIGSGKPVLEHVEDRSCWAFKMYIKVFHTPAPIYGESMGGAQEEYRFDIDSATIYEMESREDCYKRIVPVFGRDKVDFELRDGKIGLFRQHCGCRGCVSLECINGGIGALETGKYYGSDSISHARSFQIPIWDEKKEAYCAYRLDRFKLPAMMQEK